MSLAKQLHDLQEVDLDLEGKKEALKRVESQLSDDKALVEAKRELGLLQQRLAELEKEQRVAEWEIDDLQAKISPLEKKLYNGSVRNPKELASLQQEVEHLKAQKREKEDKALEVMGQVEAEQKKTKLGKGKLERVEKEWQERQRQLLAEKEALQALLARDEEKRQELASRIDPASLELYENLRLTKQGRAVARVEQGRCLGCRLTLPISELQQARAGETLAQCSSCGRILYLPM